jgi:hypothetical protein
LSKEIIPMRRIIAFVNLAFFLALPSLLRSQSEVGTWKLNAAKSKYTGVAPFKSRTITIESQEGGIKSHSEGVAGDGSPIDYSYSAKYDGKDNPITGSGAPNGADSVSLKRIDANMTESTFKKGGKVVNTGRTSISKDGKVRTITAKGTGPDGKPTSVHLVFEKQ